MKKLCATILSGVILFAGIFSISANLPAATASTIDYLDEPLIYDVWYTGKGADTFLVSIPTSGSISIQGYGFGSGSKRVYLYDEYGDTIKGGLDLGSSETSQRTGDINNLAKGTYLLKAGHYLGDYEYHIKVSLNIDSCTSVRITAPKSKTIKIVAPKGSNANGFEVRYKKAGDSEWTVKNFETTKNLNQTISGLKKNQKYSIQVRKYVLDSYGDTFYSNWTTTQTIKTK